MTTSSGKDVIMEQCCPERVDTPPMCEGKLVGSFGIPSSSRGGYNALCSSVTLGEWRQLNSNIGYGKTVTNNIYTTGGIAARMAGRSDDRGNLLTAIPTDATVGYHGLATQCNRGQEGGEDDDTVGSRQTAGQSADGLLCFRLPNDT